MVFPEPWWHRSWWGWDEKQTCYNKPLIAMASETLEATSKGLESVKLFRQG